MRGLRSGSIYHLENCEALLSIILVNTKSLCRQCTVEKNVFGPEFSINLQTSFVLIFQICKWQVL